MTRAEALAEARRRWGANVGVFEPSRISEGYYVRSLLGPFPWANVALASGPSWEAAFADADRRAGGGA